MKFLLGLAAAVVVSSFPVTAKAVEVSFEGTHLCCGACVKAVGGALGKVEGVTDANCDRENKKVTFKASDRKAALGGIRALMRAGFYGTVKVDGKAVKRKKRKSKKAAPTIAKGTFRGPHICCGGCQKAVEKAVKAVKGVDSVTIDAKKRTVAITGEDVKVGAVIAALHKAGFNARYGTRTKKKKKKTN